MPPSTVCATTASVGSNRDEATRAPPVPTGTSSRLTGSFHPMFLVVHLLLLSSLLLVSSFVGASSSRRPSRPSRWKTSGTSPSKSSKLAWWSSAMIPHRTTRTTQHFYTRTTPRETPPSFSSLSSLSSFSSSSSRDTKTNKDDRRLWRAWWWEYKDAKRERERFFGRGGGGPERARKKALGFWGTHPPPQMCCPCNERECLFLGFSVSYKTLNNREKKKKKKVVFYEAAGKDNTHY